MYRYLWDDSWSLMGFLLLLIADVVLRTIPFSVKCFNTHCRLELQQTLSDRVA